MSFHHLEKSKGLEEQAAGIHHVLYRLLAVVLGEVHEVHQ
jgi:hypothetical protein